MNTKIALLSGFAGGILGSLLFSFLVRGSNGGGVVRPAGNGVISARDIQLVDEKGRLRAELGISQEGGAGLFIYDTNRRVRLVLGAYPPGEGELPFVVLNDTDQNAAGIFRLVGAKQVPFLIFKHRGGDRAISGLAESNPDQFFLKNQGKLLLGSD